MKKTRRNWSAFFLDSARMLRFAWDAKPRLSLISILLSVVQSLLPVGAAWLLKLLLDAVAAYYDSSVEVLFQNISLLTIGYVTIFSIQKLIGPIDHFFRDELRRAIALLVQGDVYRQTLSFEGIAYLEDPKYHDLQLVSGQTVQNAPFIIADGLRTLIQSVSLLASFIGLLLLLSPLLTVLVIISSIPHLLIHLQFGRDRFRLALDLSPVQRESAYLSSALTSLRVAKELRLFGLQEYLLGKWRRVAEQNNDAQSGLQRKELKWMLSLEFLSFLGMGLAFYFILRGIFNQQLSVGDIALYSSAVAGVQAGLLTFVRATAQVSEIHLFFEQYETIKALPQPIKVAKRPLPLPPLQKGIVFEDIWFRYSDETPWVLQGVSFEIPADSCVALVGINGAGKSTLIKLITRLYDPTHGRILWDGVDICDFDVVEYRQQLSTVFQDFVRYQLPVWENIGVGDVAHMDQRARIMAAAEKADIAGRVAQMPEGYETRLSRWLGEGEQGTDLSGGEWQRIAIARSFMRQSELLLLDEPTAALDAEAEWRVIRLFEQMRANRTCLLISHRFSTVQMADCIAVLDNGRITEQGTHAELLAQTGAYARLYTMQAEKYQA